LRRVPEYKCPGVGDKIGFVERQARTEKTQVLKFAAIRERRLSCALNGERERRPIAE